MVGCPAECSATEAHGKQSSWEKGMVSGIKRKTRTASDDLAQSSFRRAEGNRSQTLRGGKMMGNEEVIASIVNTFKKLLSV